MPEAVGATTLGVEFRLRQEQSQASLRHVAGAGGTSRADTVSL